MEFHIIGEYWGQAKSEHQDSLIMFACSDEDASKLQQMDGKKVVLDIKEHRPKKSNAANAYLWVLCTKIGQHPQINKSKDQVYMDLLHLYGQYEDYEIPLKAVEKIAPFYKFYEVIDKRARRRYQRQDSTIARVRFYIGSSEYNSEQMSRLINGAVADAKELGIDTWTPGEIAAALSVWRPEQSEWRS